MRWYSVVAIYFLLWFLCLFVVLPFRLRHDREDVQVRGQADSAPPQFSLWRTAVWTTALSAGLMVLVWINYVHGWVGQDALDFLTPDRFR